MAQVNEQRAMADELADIISNPGYGATELDDVRIWSEPQAYV
jgi:hypothetical protein